MTTEQKIKYIQSFYKLIVDAQTYREALSHAGFTRGLLAAWHADMTIRTDQYRGITTDIDNVMEVKRNLPTRGDVV